MYAAGIGDGVGYSDSEVTLDWRKDTDWIKASSYSGTVTLKRAFSVEGGSVLHNGVVSDLSTIDSKTLNAHVHSFPDAEHKAHKDPTDYTPGNIEYWRCSDCGNYYSDIDGYNEVTEAETVIPPLNGMLKEGMYAVGDTLPLIAGTKIALADGSTVTISENTMLDISYENKSLKLGNNVVDSVDGSGMSFIGRCLVQHDSGRDVYTVKKLCYKDGTSTAAWTWKGCTSARVTLQKLVTVSDGVATEAEGDITLGTTITKNNTSYTDYYGYIAQARSYEYGYNFSDIRYVYDAPYVNWAGEDMGRQRSVSVTSDGDLNLSDGWYAIRYGGLAKKPCYIDGTVNLILYDGCNFSIDGGIVLKPGAHLTIWGQSDGSGRLTANGKENYRAGIGWDSNKSGAGSLTINGGKIVAYGGKGAPALGSASGRSGVITINGGKITAYGCNGDDTMPGASGIGTGTGFMNDVYFNGGTSEITGGYYHSNITGDHYTDTENLYPPIGAYDGNHYIGSIHLGYGMKIVGAKLDDKGRLAPRVCF